ncbi:hypothetical protein AYI69_g9561 [Smittium culicis]|uniref:Uncharacterized protein n=1 Tax=Smittium culicis TaxID=133412 RepID=A0A1R1XBW7_9FUNG|nr:hypothetical protein AYI69_g9561 [Smittium culicis]
MEVLERISHKDSKNQPHGLIIFDTNSVESDKLEDLMGLESSFSDKKKTIKLLSLIVCEDLSVDILDFPPSLSSDVKNVLFYHLKTNYKIFGSESLQKRIKWDDSALRNSIYPKDAIVNWDRIEAIARYIAEINLR